MKKKKKKSIASKLMATFLTALLFECILMSSVLIFAGVLKKARENEYQYFNERVESVKKSLEGEMNNVWTNFDHQMNQISHYISAENMKDDKLKDSAEQVFLATGPYLIDALRQTKTCGAFLILSNTTREDGTYPAFYIRNMDPSRKISDNSNFLLRVGPFQVAEELDIVTDKNWAETIHLTAENEEFYRKPMENAYLSDDERLLGYWSTPFQLTENDEKVVTYSVPLKDKEGNLIGVFGVDISVDYLYRFLEKGQKQSNASLGYIIGMRRNADEGIAPIVMHAVLQGRSIHLDEELTFEECYPEYNIYKIVNQQCREKIYANVDQMGLYYHNTPFEQEEWYLIGLLKHSELYALSDKIAGILILSFVVTLAFGFIFSVFVSRWFTKPIINLAKEVNENSYGKLRTLEPTNLIEIDDLSDTINHSHRRLLDLSAKVSRIIDLTDIAFGAYEINHLSDNVFITNHLQELFNFTDQEISYLCSNKDKFIERLDEIKKNVTEEKDIFRVTADSGERFVKITQTETEEAILGVVMEVTEEVMQTRNLRLERDYDPLTGIQNRNVFNRMMASYNKQLTPDFNIAVGIYDLNNLKKVNDSYGHDKGDIYICNCVKLITKVFPGYPFYRIGGDEFVQIFVDIKEEEISARSADLVIEMNHSRETTPYFSGIAFGYAFYDSSKDKSLEDVLKRADERMYRNKKEMKERQDG